MNSIVIGVLVFLLVLLIATITVVVTNKSQIKETIQNNSLDVTQMDMYLINLDRRPDRLQVTTKLLNNLGYDNIIRHSAIDGKQLSPEYVKRIVDKDALQPILDNKRQKHHELSIGAVGCYLSHMNVWNEIQNNPNECAVVFEDDTNPTIRIDKINTILNELPPDWDILLLGGLYNRKNGVSSNLCKVNMFLCAHAYIINKKGIAKLLNNALPMKKQVDWMMFEDSSVCIYGLKENSWMQNQQIAATDIQTPISL